MYTRRYDMGDSSIIMNTDDVIHQAFEEVLANKVRVIQTSEYELFEQVRMTNDVGKIANRLMTVYTYHEALMIARSLAGQIVKIFDIEELQDDNGIKGTYYSIEDDLGMMYVFSSDFFSRV